MGKYCFGVDLGGTTVKIGLFDTEGTVLEKWEIPTRKEENGSKILPDIARAILDKTAEKDISREDVAGVGIGVPGPVDDNGVVHMAVNLGWGVMNINETLGGLLQMPVKAGNDANVAALGEMWCGGGKGCTNMVLATLGTGVGGGIIINGKMVTGATGAGGEIGHIHIEDNELDACGCGNHGCLEQYASATGVVRLAERKLASSAQESVLRTAKADGRLSAKAVFDAVKEGDALACEVAEQFGDYLERDLPQSRALSIRRYLSLAAVCPRLVRSCVNMFQNITQNMYSTVPEMRSSSLRRSAMMLESMAQRSWY